MKKFFKDLENWLVDDVVGFLVAKGFKTMPNWFTLLLLITIVGFAVSRVYLFIKMIVNWVI